MVEVDVDPAVVVFALFSLSRFRERDSVLFSHLWEVLVAGTSECRCVGLPKGFGGHALLIVCNTWYEHYCRRVFVVAAKGGVLRMKTGEKETHVMFEPVEGSIAAEGKWSSVCREPMSENVTKTTASSCICCNSQERRMPNCLLYTYTGSFFRPPPEVSSGQWPTAKMSGDGRILTLRGVFRLNILQ